MELDNNTNAFFLVTSKKIWIASSEAKLVEISNHIIINYLLIGAGFISTTFPFSSNKL